MRTLRLRKKLKKEEKLTLIMKLFRNGSKFKKN
jgi:hypothetical protein